MKKLMSIIVAAALIFGSFTISFGAVPTDVAGTDYEEAVSVLMELGVINGYEDGTYKPERIVTRAEMAKLIVVALGLESNANAVTSKFPDMGGAEWAQGFVSLASDLGVVIGYPDGTFKPSNTVTYDEATTMILRSLGYSDKSLGGVWPSNYVVKAKTLGVLDDMTGKTGGANRGDIAKMLFNALSLDIGTVNANGTWVANGNDTMLTRLDAEFEPADVITGEEDSAINIRAFVGAYAETYLNEDGEIIAVAPQSEFLTGEYDGTAFTANDKDYTVSATLAGTDKPYFLNGAPDGTDSLDAYSDETVTLAVELSGKTISKIYSIQSWVVSEDGLFEKADATDITDDQTLFGFDFVLTDGDEIDLDSFMLVGASELSDIDVDDVVYVYADDSDNIRKIAVGTTDVEGTITKVSSDGDYTINGKTYSVTEENVTTDLEGAAGDEVQAYLDAFGDIYLMEITSGTSEDYAIVLEVGNGSGSGISGFEPAMKLFLSSGSAKTFTVDESDAALKHDYFTNTATPKVWVNSPDEGSFIQYGLNDDDVIDSIDESTMLNATSTITAKGYFNGYAIDKDAAIFTYSGSDLSDEDNYDVKSLNEVLDMTGVTAKYVVDADTHNIAAMILLTGITDEDSYGVAIDWATNTSTPGYEITFLVNGVEETYNASLAAYNKAKADNTKLYKINFNLAGNVTSLTEPLTFVSFSDGSIDGYVITAGSSVYTLDRDAVYYQWNEADSVYETGELSDITDGILYDVFGDSDAIYDIVLLPPTI